MRKGYCKSVLDCQIHVIVTKNQMIPSKINYLLPDSCYLIILLKHWSIVNANVKWKDGIRIDLVCKFQICQTLDAIRVLFTSQNQSLDVNSCS